MSRLQFFLTAAERSFVTDWSPSGGESAARDDRLDSLFLVLSEADRRHVLQYFVQHEECAASVSDLIEYVHERSGDEVTADALETRFHHFTLPKLVEHGVIEFDDRSRMVRYRGPTVLEEILTAVDQADLQVE